MSKNLLWCEYCAELGHHNSEAHRLLQESALTLGDAQKQLSAKDAEVADLRAQLEAKERECDELKNLLREAAK